MPTSRKRSGRSKDALAREMAHLKGRRRRPDFWSVVAFLMSDCETQTVWWEPSEPLLGY